MDIIDEYRSIYKEELDAALVEELRQKYSEEEIRKLLGLELGGRPVKFVKKIRNFSYEDEGTLHYVRVKILKKRLDKEIQRGNRTSKLSVYIAGDDSGICILSDRGGKGFEVGKVYLLGPVKVRGFQSLGNVSVPELYVQKSTNVQELVYPKFENVSIDEFEIEDLRPFVYRPFIATIEGTVSKVYDKARVLLTDQGQVYVRVQPYSNWKSVSPGTRVRIIGVRPANGGLATSAISKLEILEEAPTKPAKEIVGFLVDAVERTSRKGREYHIYVLFDGENLVRAFSREPLGVSIGDIIKVAGQEIDKGIRVVNYELLAGSESADFSGEVIDGRQVSEYSPKYLLKVKDFNGNERRVFTDEERKVGEEISGMIKRNTLGEKRVGVLVESYDYGTVLDVEYDENENVSKIKLHIGEKEIEIKQEGDRRGLEGKDVKIVKDAKGNVIRLEKLERDLLFP